MPSAEITSYKPTTRPLAWTKKESPASCRALSSSTWGLSRVRRVGVRLAHYDIRALGNAQSIRVVNDHMDCAYSYTAASGASAWWSAPAIAGLLVEGNRPDPGHQDSRVRRRIVAHRHDSDGASKQTSALRVG